MSIRSPDINADYLQIRDFEIVRGDTFGFSIRLLVDGQVSQLTNETNITFAIYSNNSVAYQHIYKSSNTTQDNNGYIYISMLPTETAILRPAEQYTYELEWLINPSTIYTLLKGKIKLITDKIRH